MLRNAIAVLILVGCAWGQDSTQQCIDGWNESISKLNECVASLTICADTLTDAVDEIKRERVTPVAWRQSGTLAVPVCDKVRTYPAGDGCNTCTDACGTTSCTLAYCGFHPIETANPEPMDVEPLTTEKEEIVFCSYPNTEGCTLMPFGGDAMGLGRKEKVKHYTCADKRRVLLTDEGGGKHCFLFTQSKN